MVYPGIEVVSGAMMDILRGAVLLNVGSVCTDSSVRLRYKVYQDTMQETCGVGVFIGWEYMKLYQGERHGPSQMGSALETPRYSPLLFPLPSVFLIIGNGWFMNKRELASNVHQAYKLMKPAFSILVSNRFWPYNIAVSYM
jgi:hypothetical protein